MRSLLSGEESGFKEIGSRLVWWFKKKKMGTVQLCVEFYPDS